MTKDEKAARGCASKIVDYTLRWGCPHTFLSDRGTEFISQVSRAVYETLGTVQWGPDIAVGSVTRKTCRNSGHYRYTPITVFLPLLGPQ